MDLVELLRKPEGKTLEFKRDLTARAKIVRSVVAMANTSGGRILIGVEDGTGNVAGVQDALKAEERVASLISDSIEPQLMPEIEILPWRDTHVVSIEVHPSAVRPHHVRSEGVEKGTYIRVGSTNRRADEALRQEISRYVSRAAYDEQPMPDFDSEVIDFRAASELFAPTRTIHKRDLETLGLVTRNQGRLVPTVGGMLLFGKDRLSHFPDAWIQFGRFAGNDRSKILDQTELRDYPARALERVISVIQDHMHRGAEIGALKRTDRWDLPPVAVREAVINAVTHADYAQRGAPIRVALYDNRLEVENPGILPLGLTIEDIRQGVSKLRNRVIGRVFHELGLVEQWGSGIQRMTAACRNAGLPEPAFQEIGFRFRVTLSMERVTEPAADKTDERILAFLSDGRGRSTAEIASYVGLTTRSIRTRLAALTDRGLVRAVGSGPKDPKRRYYRMS